MYFTSRKNRLAADSSSAIPQICAMRITISSGTQTNDAVTCTGEKMNTSTMTTAATEKSMSCDSNADSGNTARGNAILVTRLALAVRQAVANRIDETTNAQGSALTATPSTSAMLTGRPDILARPTFTMTPADVMIMGIRIAQKNPMTDCLYFTRMSRRVSMYSRSWWRRRMRNRLNMVRLGGRGAGYLAQIFQGALPCDQSSSRSWRSLKVSMLRQKPSY